MSSKKYAKSKLWMEDDFSLHDDVAAMDDYDDSFEEDEQHADVNSAIMTDVKEVVPVKPKFKVEMVKIFLSETIKDVIMDILREIHGSNFRLKGRSDYSESKKRINHNYWTDRGQLVVKKCYNYAVKQNEDSLANAILSDKLEKYGFYAVHCKEVLRMTSNDLEKALELLYCKYFNFKLPSKEAITTSENLEHRFYEMEGLKSMLESECEEKVVNKHWLIRVNLPLLYDSKQKPKIVKQIKTPTVAVCKLFKSAGVCKFGKKCRFSHVIQKSVAENRSKPEKRYFFLEIRFPDGSNYPDEIPIISFYADDKNFERHTCLRVTELLVKDAIKNTLTKMAFVYSLVEMLERTEELLDRLEKEKSGMKVHPDEPLFPIESAVPEEENNEINDFLVLASTLPKRERATDRNSRLVIDDEITIGMKRKQCNDKYRKMQRCRSDLPAWSVKNEILSKINHNQVVVISGETGCGKSTQVPQFILDDWLLSRAGIQPGICNMETVDIICTQPRRLSAIGVARRVAEERVEMVGHTIGYQIRLENCLSTRTRLLFCTTGILLRRLEKDPMLSSVTHIILDEVHERSEESDFLLMILKDIITTRKDLKIILMSATMYVDIFPNYFGSSPLLSIPGRTFPVEEIFLEEILSLCNYTLEENSKYARQLDKGFRKELQSVESELAMANIESSESYANDNKLDENLTANQLFNRYADYSTKVCKTLLMMNPEKVNIELITTIIEWVVQGDHNYPREGSILVFLPGMAEIRELQSALECTRLFSSRNLENNFLIIPLHSSISNEKQTTIFSKLGPGVRRIVLATNIAETSITIDDCVFVIDSGKINEKRFDTNKNMASLDTVWVSRANSIQRRGRAGRVMPGLCIYLYTEHRYRHLNSQPVPEILRTPLDQIILKIKKMAIFKPKTLQGVLESLLEPPSHDSIVTSVSRLKEVGALNVKEELTALGHHLCALPVDVKIGKLMIFGVIFGCVDAALTIAAFMSHKSPFVSSFNQRNTAEARKKSFSFANSDHLTNLNAYRKWHELSNSSMERVKRFTEENFLSLNVMKMIAGLKNQFLEILVDIDFIKCEMKSRKNDVDNVFQITGSQLNCNDDKPSVLSAILCAALSPNIIKVLSTERVFIKSVSGAVLKDPDSNQFKLKTKNDGYVNLHPSSINAKEMTFRSPYLVYLEKMKTNKLYVFDSTMVSAVALVLFSNSVSNIELCNGIFTISIESGWIIFSFSSQEEAQMLQHMRSLLQRLLEKKIKDPSLDFLTDPLGKRIITCIFEMITQSP